MSLVDNATSEMQAEVLHLRQELQMRDQLVQQLSEELFRLVKEKPAQVKQLEAAYPKALQQQLQVIKQQLSSQHRAVANRNAEITQMRQSLQKLSERNDLLEQAVQEIPEVYRQRFAARVGPIKQRMTMLQRENQQLHTRLEMVNYHLKDENPLFRTN